MKKKRSYIPREKRQLSNEPKEVKRRQLRVLRKQKGVCCGCGLEKDNRDLSQCSSCREKLKGLPSLTPERKRERNMFYHYGITNEEYLEKSIRQGGVCAICGMRGRNNKSLCVDHCHKTNKIRELLCDRCNVVLGAVEESIHLLNNIKDYILKHNR